MILTQPVRDFHPGPPDDAGIISWVHIGDLHMVQADQQNHRDLLAIVDQVNRVFASSVAFVFLPGDVAEHGRPEEYSIAREALNQLKAPWCSIIGDHDVQQRSYVPYQSTMAPERYYSFRIGPVSFFALNAFDVPDPASFCLLAGQLDWLEDQVRAVGRNSAVLLLHCYPSELKDGGQRLRAIVEMPAVRLVDMGHTHYNEVANDGLTLYTATRSTGQIEEGPVGFSITNLDDGVVSWRFVELGKLPAVIITSPADERLMADDAELDSFDKPAFRVRAKVWADRDIASVEATFANSTLALQRISGSQVWEASFTDRDMVSGVQSLRVVATDAEGHTAVDEIRVLVGANRPIRERAERDQDNALEAWPEHGLLGTQLGPNKNGRKW